MNNNSTAITFAGSTALQGNRDRTADLQKIKQYEAIVALEIYKLRIAYPVQARNFTPEEAEATKQLWAEVFVGVEPELLHSAVIRFIKDDRKAFFPSPGQIMGVVEKIKSERKWAEYERRERAWQYRSLQRTEATAHENPAKYLSDSE